MDETELIVQGFRGGGGRKPYVFIGELLKSPEGDFIPNEISLTPENAHILSEEIRKHAEFSLQQAEEQGDK